MNFTKMNGLGNDFIVIAGESALPDNAAELAVQLCNRFLESELTGLYIFCLLIMLISVCAS